MKLPGPFVPSNFGALPPEQSAYESSTAVVLPVPYEATVTYGSGTRAGPPAIIEASRNLELFDEELLCDVAEVGIHTLPPLEAVASGPEGMCARVEENVAALAAAGKLSIVLGGEHSITVGAVRGIRKAAGNLSVLQIDAHLDLRETYEGSPYSHACCMRRLVEEGIPVAQVGIRSFSEEEYLFAKERGLTIVTAREALTEDPEETAARVLDALSDLVYVTLDVDGLDPSVIPSTGTPEPGGLGYYETLHILRTVATNKRIVGFDIVELAPRPGDMAGPFTCARLAYKMIGYSLRLGL